VYPINPTQYELALRRARQPSSADRGPRFGAATYPATVNGAPFSVNLVPDVLTKPVTVGVDAGAEVVAVVA
jgi:hypothetical protein